MGRRFDSNGPKEVYKLVLFVGYAAIESLSVIPKLKKVFMDSRLLNLRSFRDKQATSFGRNSLACLQTVRVVQVLLKKVFIPLCIAVVDR